MILINLNEENILYLELVLCFWFGWLEMVLSISGSRREDVGSVVVDEYGGREMLGSVLSMSWVASGASEWRAHQ